MSNLKINKDQLLSLYLKQIDIICNECDWKVRFEPNEIISIIVDILERNSHLVQSDAFESGYEAGLDAAYISSQSSGRVGDPQ